MGLNDDHPLDANGYAPVDYFCSSLPATMSQEFPAMAPFADTQSWVWDGGDSVVAGTNPIDGMAISPGFEIPCVFGDYATLSSPFNGPRPNGRPLAYHDASAMQHRGGGGLLSPQESIGSTLMDTSFPPWPEPLPAAYNDQLPLQLPAKQTDGRCKGKRQDESPGLESKKKGKTATKELAVKELTKGSTVKATKKHMNKGGDEAKQANTTKTKTKTKPTAATPSNPASKSPPDRAGHRRAPPPTQFEADTPRWDSDDEPYSDGPSPPLTQRERNRMAATKCRAKTKAATGRLALDQQTMADERDMLIVEADALRREALQLRMLVLQHHGCGCTDMQSYIRNSAHVVGESGGRAIIFGPNGCGHAAEVDDNGGGG